jgi:hypothetical protein
LRSTLRTPFQLPPLNPGFGRDAVDRDTVAGPMAAPSDLAPSGRRGVRAACRTRVCVRDIRSFSTGEMTRVEKQGEVRMVHFAVETERVAARARETTVVLERHRHA